MEVVVVKSVISSEDCQRLEKAWYDYNAFKELITTGLVMPNILEQYKSSFAEYQKAWSLILSTGKYFQQDYTLGQTYSWRCDFLNKIVTITDIA